MVTEEDMVLYVSDEDPENLITHLDSEMNFSRSEKEGCDCGEA